MNQAALLKYNFRVMMLNNWLLLAFPVAVSQLTVFWLVLTRQFTQELPAMSVEMVSPILAAFLGAHLLNSEYRSRVGAILASRPVNIGKIVFSRLVVMLFMVWGLALISLLAYRFMGKPFDIVPPFIACIPSTLFLAMLALTFATLFRSALAGFAVAALYWSLDLVPGAPLFPYLSLRSLAAWYAVQNNPMHQTFLTDWWIAKVLLLALSVALYLVHNRMVFSVGSALTMRSRRRSVISAGVILTAYLLSGAVLKVSYGYMHRGELSRGDLAWFRYQLGPFGPIPVEALFGSDFRAYVGDIGNPWRPSAEEADLLGATAEHNTRLHASLAAHPNSMWATSIAYALCQLEGRNKKTPDQAVAYLRDVLQKYPYGPYVGPELRDIARIYLDDNRPDQALAPFEELLKRAPTSSCRSEAFRYLYEHAMAAGNKQEALTRAQSWAQSAPIFEEFEALFDAAQLKAELGDTAAARDLAKQAVAAAGKFDAAADAGGVTLGPKLMNDRKQLSRRIARDAERLAR